MLGIKQRHRLEVLLSKKTRGDLRKGVERRERERRKEEIWVDRAKGLGGV